jgi:16S rRNA (cytosine967-C5)-methyltransferase
MVNREGAYANLRLPELLAKSGLEQRDRAFATELSYGTLRMQGRYDAIIRQKIDRPLDQLDTKIHDLLRLGLHQIDYMRTPDHAAVSATVELARFVAGESKATYVNAILRAITREPELFSQLDLSSKEPSPQSFAAKYSHPEWIVKSFHDQLKNWDEVEELLQADNTPVAPHLVAWPGKASTEELVAEGGIRLEQSSFAVESEKTPDEYLAIRERRAGVQDLGSQMITEIFFNTISINPGDELAWLDMCAGPGGKAALLYNLIETLRPKDSFQANELQEHRVELVARVVPRAKISNFDGREIESFPRKYDRILLDAPCTGLGALRRRPEARWRRSMEDLKNLVTLQRELLDAAYQLLETGGVIGYATCSPHIAETLGQVLDFTHRHKDMQIINAADFEIGPSGGIKPDGTVQLWTHRNQTDSMFMALLQKKS